MAEPGLVRPAVSRDWGGGGGGVVELAISSCRGARPSSLDVAMAYVGTFIPGLVIFRHGSDEQRDRFATACSTGEYRFSVAISPSPTPGPMWPAELHRGRAGGDDSVLNGQKTWCTGAGFPGRDDRHVCADRSGRAQASGISLCSCPNDAPGVEIRRTPTLARHLLGTNEVYFDDVVVPKCDQVGPPDEGFGMLMAGSTWRRR